MSAASRRFWGGVAGVLKEGEPVFVAVVAAASAHSPGTAGARLWLAPDGRRAGTIGGGVMELRLVDRARKLLVKAEPYSALEELHHSADAAGSRSGMICAGRQTNLSLVCRPDRDLVPVESLLDHLVGDRSCRLSIHSQRGLAVVASDPEPTASPRVLIRYGDEWTYEEEMRERRRLAIFGGGHCGQALARVMAGIGWYVSVWETRSEVLADGLDADADVHLVRDLTAASAEVSWPETTAAVVMTTDVATDVKALLGALRQPFPFVGVMGAAAKLVEIRRRLRRAGFADADLSRLVAPVGLPIPSHTPEEIAVSVAGQLLGWRLSPG